MLYDWYQHIYFSQPAFFKHLPPLAVVLAAVDLLRRDQEDPAASQATVMVSTVRSFRGTRSWKNSLRPLPFIFRLLALCCLIVALARPQSRNDEQLVNGEGIDIMLCLDISGSMLAQDFNPNRMEAAKERRRGVYRQSGPPIV